MIVYITKYALTQGILEKKVELFSKSMVTELIEAPTRYGAATLFRQSFHKPYWHENREDAVKHANELRTRKISSLKKSIAKLEKLSF